MASPFPYYYLGGNMVSITELDKFFEYYHMCKRCLVRPMCLKFDRRKHLMDVIVTKKPCKEFLRLVG